MNDLEKIMKLDLEFCKACKTGGGKAWASYFMDDGFMTSREHEKNIIGKLEIEEAMSSVFQLKDIKFDWWPVFAVVSDDGSLGVTNGLYERSYEVDGKLFEQKGKYTSIWKKVNGEWKILFDTGN